MSLRIIMGNMFSGKTTEMIRRLKRYKVIGKQVVVINSQKDIRSTEEVLRTMITSPSGASRRTTSPP